MRIPDWITKELIKVGLTRVPADKILAIAQHLLAEKLEYDLYRPVVGGIPYTSRKTVIKIKELLEQGKLDFLVKHPDGLAGIVIDQLGKDSAGDQAENIDLDPGDLLDSYRMGLINLAEGYMAEGWAWDLAHLKGLAIPNDDAISMLLSYDALFEARYEAQVSGLNFRGFEEYIRLHYQVIFKTRYSKAKLPYVQLASRIHVSGLLSGSKSLSTAGEDILRYEVWEGFANEDAYYQSLKRYKRTPKALSTLKAQVEDLNQRGDDDE